MDNIFDGIDNNIPDKTDYFSTFFVVKKHDSHNVLSTRSIKNV